MVLKAGKIHSVQTLNLKPNVSAHPEFASTLFGPTKLLKIE